MNVAKLSRVMLVPLSPPQNHEEALGVAMFSTGRPDGVKSSRSWVGGQELVVLA